MTYLLKEGLNQPLIDLVAIDPQPRCPGLEYSRTNYAASGAVTREAPFVRLIWDVLQDQTEYEDLLEQFGLDSLVSANVTITLPGPLFSDVRYSGRAVRPVAGETVNRESYFIRDVVIVIKDLAVAS